MLTIDAFFDACIGKWSIERTYHYLDESATTRIERSHTDYDIRDLSNERRQKVLTDNERSSYADTNYGFYLAFDTLSERGERVQMDLNILFVPTGQDGGVIEGDYLRDRAYEETRPMVARFRYDPARAELLMTTRYTRTVSVDSITLVNPELRLRQIKNFARPAFDHLPLKQLTLVGFGVEQKVA